MTTYCDINTCEDCPRYGDDCDGDKRVEHTDLISRADAICDKLLALPSADAEPKMTEEVREALMRLTMCAREECYMCKYKDKCGFEFQYNISTENMNTILEALSADAEQIVYCMDCAKSEPLDEHGALWYCKAHDRTTLRHSYCDNGERKGGEDE